LGRALFKQIFERIYILMTEKYWLRLFTANLLKRMTEARVSQKELADLTGLSQGTISKYTRAKQMPTTKALLNISYVLQCTVDELIDFGEQIR
jgi:transcriptional regulator with XRE-family HTH domain